MAEKKKPKMQPPKVLQDVEFHGPDDEKGKKELPNLFECMESTWKEAALVWAGGRITIRFDGPSILVSLELSQAGKQCTFEVQSLATVLHELEKAITNGLVSWRPTWKKSKEGLQKVDDVI